MNFHFVFLLLLFSFSANGQQQIDDSLTQAMLAGDSLFKEKTFEQASLKYDEVMQLSIQQSDWDNFLLAGYMKAQCFQKSGDVQKAINESNQLIAKVEEDKIKHSKTLGDIWHKLGVYYYIDDDYDNSQKAYLRAIQVRTQLFGENDLDLSRSYHNLGVTYFAKGNFDAAVDNLRTAITIRKTHDDPALIAQTYQELGIVSLNSGDYSKGLEYQQAALNILQNEEDQSLFDIGRNHSVIGILNRKLQHYSIALEHFEKAKTIYLELFGEIDSDVADCYNNIANVFDDLGDYEMAIENYQHSLKINRQLVGEESARVARNYNNLGYTFTKIKRFDEALNYNEKALAIRLKLYGDYDPVIGNSYDNIADVLVEKGDLKQAMQYYQLAILNMFSDFRDTSIFAIPDFEKHHLIGTHEELLIFLFDKAKAFLKYYSASQEAKTLEAAFELFEKCDEVIVTMRHTYESDASKLFLLENAIPIYEKALETIFSLNEKKPKNDYLEAAFHFMEKSKSVLLLSSRQEDKAKWIANIPENLLSRENEFKADINYYVQKLNENLENDSLKVDLQNKLLLEKEGYQLFVEQLEKRYPKYFQEKYNKRVLDIQKLQNQLEHLQSTLMEYFVGSEDIYVFVLSAEKKELFKIPVDFDLESWIEKLLRAINHPNDQKINPTDYPTAAFSIYQAIWKPIESGLSEKLIVIPDGLLNYLPFDALLTAPASGSQFKQFPYLIKNHQISYAYSAGVFMDNFQVSERRNAKKSFLGVAPEFKNSSNFTYLPHSVEEAEKIQRHFGGDVLKGKFAQKVDFLKTAGDYKIVHISSHAAAVDSNTLVSWIGFIDDSPQVSDYKLYLADLYNLKLNAELVVLSACETSRGKLSKGEGIMSLARGFAFSGCQSMVTTLWPVNHSATAQIMEGFYQNLSNGIDKSKALHDAKLSYIEDDKTDQNSAHPYYWSAYSLVGNTYPVDATNTVKWWFWLAALILIGLFLFAVYKYRKS